MFESVRQHKIAFAAGTAGVAGLGYGAYRGASAPEGEGVADRASDAARTTLGVGLDAAILGGAAFAGRRVLGRTAWGSVKGAGAAYGRSMTNAFKEGWSARGILSHGAVGLTLGGMVGGALAYRRSDGDLGDTVGGAVVGAGLGAVAVPIANRVVSNWRRLGHLFPEPAPGKATKGWRKLLGMNAPREASTLNKIAGKTVKSGILLALAAGTVGLAHALAPPEYQDEAAALPDGAFDQGYGMSLSQRLAAMNGTGDVVLGLHNRR